MSNIREVGFSKLTCVEEAKEIMFTHFSSFIKLKKSKHVEIDTFDTCGEICTEDIFSQVNLPRFNRSAMDGFAVRANETFGATEDSPVQRKLQRIVEIGMVEKHVLEKNKCIRISTGAPMPEGADAVVKIEDTKRRGKVIDFFTAVTPTRNVSVKGENITKGQLLLKNGHKLRPYDISMLYDLGIKRVKVQAPLIAGVLSTGSELVSYKSEESPTFGKVYDSNKPGLRVYLEELGVKSTDLGTVDDDKELLQVTIQSAIDKVDMILVTGGTSVGSMDLVPEIIASLGKLLFHGIAIRPGKPFGLGKVCSKPVFMLPGYPLAAFLNFELFVIPFIKMICSIKILPNEVVEVKTSQKIPSKSGYRDFVRLKKVGIDGTLPVVEKIRITGASILFSFVDADFLLEVPEDLEGYEEGAIVNARVLK